jgi:hypothetical protein
MLHCVTGLVSGGFGGPPEIEPVRKIRKIKDN